MPTLSRMGLLVSMLLALSLSGAPQVPTEPVETTTHFRFYGNPRTHGSIAKIAPEAEDRFDKLCRMISACEALERPIDVYVAEDPEHFAQAFPEGSPMAEWAVGVAFPRQYRIVLRAFGSAMFSLAETFDHEVSHVLLYAAAPKVDLPRWFVEGLAIWHAGEGVLERLESAQKAALTGNLYDLADISRGFPAEGAGVELAYAQSALFVRWLYREHGPGPFQQLVAELRGGRAFDDAFRAVYGGDAQGLFSKWAQTLEETSSFWLTMRDGTILWALMVVLFIWAYVIKRRERREAIEALGDRDDAEEAWAQLEAERKTGAEPTLH